jgi:hypothetical protein
MCERSGIRVATVQGVRANVPGDRSLTSCAEHLSTTDVTPILHTKRSRVRARHVPDPGGAIRFQQGPGARLCTLIDPWIRFPCLPSKLAVRNGLWLVVLDGLVGLQKHFFTAVSTAHYRCNLLGDMYRISYSYEQVVQELE